MMSKHSAIEYSPTDTLWQDGTFSNPVAILFSDSVLYRINIINANLQTGNVIIRDTLPSYLKYRGTSIPVLPDSSGMTSDNPPRRVLRWTLPSLASMATDSVSFYATPEEGSVASQPLYINGAWVQVSDTIYVPTGNKTYHQGAGAAMVLFSTTTGGSIYNAEPQALDYTTSPRTGVIVVPDEGYRFTGWSYPSYISLKGKEIPAGKGIMLYDTVAVYGNVELTANFEPITYHIRYYLNGSVNPAYNPDTFTVLSDDIILEAPQKSGDIFVGWTGSNGSLPQIEIEIPKGSTGERIYYANFLYSGSDETTLDFLDPNNIWTSGNYLYIRINDSSTLHETVANPTYLARIYSTEGVLVHHQTILTRGITKIKLPKGIYVVTLNNGIGSKVIIQ